MFSDLDRDLVHDHNITKFPWPTPHAADPSLCSMSFLGTSWHDLICIGSLVLSY